MADSDEEYLRKMGDSRYGGSLPLGGKAYAGGSGSGPKYQTRGDPNMFITVPAAGKQNEDAAYDHEMNVRESMMEDKAKQKAMIAALRRRS
jgi:hypothetical protein